MTTGVLTNKEAILDECAKASLRVEHLPYYYEVHLGMPCNEKCIMCVPDGKHKRDQISLEEFTSFFDQIKPVAEHLTLIGGETFMYPWFNQVLDLLAQHPITVTIITNGTMLTEKISPRLVALHALELKFSIDAATRDTYYRIRGRDVFDKVIANVKRFSDLTRDKPNIRRILVFVVMRENLGRGASVRGPRAKPGCASSVLPAGEAREHVEGVERHRMAVRRRRAVVRVIQRRIQRRHEAGAGQMRQSGPWS